LRYLKMKAELGAAWDESVKRANQNYDSALS